MSKWVTISFKVMEKDKKIFEKFFADYENVFSEKFEDKKGVPCTKGNLLKYFLHSKIRRFYEKFPELKTVKKDAKQE